MRKLAIYIHWPFCLALCPYCDFNVKVKRDISDHESQNFIDAIEHELNLLAEMAGDRHIPSVFFGGGTPSLMPPDLVAKILDKIGKTFILDRDAEITLEANPENAAQGIFSAFCAAGINRLSLGVQSLNDDALKFLGRKHDGHQARYAIELAQKIFPETSFDLIAARPEQDEMSWRQELQEALALAPTHLSIYQLTCPEGTLFGRDVQRGRFSLPDENLAARLYLLSDELCQSYGLARYEIANHARPGHESRHNLAYWHYHDYAGLGPGAAGRLTLDSQNLFVATQTPRAPKTWQSSAKDNDFWHHYQCAALSAKTRSTEMLIMGLRLAQGLSLARHRALTGQTLDQNKIAALSAQGLLRQTASHLCATKKGALLLDQITAQLVQ